MISKGIIHVNDLWTETRQLFGYNGFMEKYNIQLNFVDFYSVPRHWLTDFKTKLNKCEMKQCLLERLVQQKHPSKWVYKKITSSIKYSRGHEAKWANTLETDIPEGD